MKDNFFHNFIHLAMVPSNQNNFRPWLLRRATLIFYSFLVIAVLLFFSPIGELKIKTFLANLSQDLIIGQVNPDRQETGLLPLAKNNKLTQAAQLKAEDMIKRGYFSHIGPDNEKPCVWLDRVGYHYAAAGENLAIDFSDPVVLEQAWLNSPSHAKNILNKYFNDIGIGIASGTMNNRKTTVVVMFLGREITPLLAKEPTIAEESIASAKTLANVSPQEPVVTRVIEESALDQENTAILGLEKKGGVAASEPAASGLKIFLVEEGPGLLRLLLTAIFILLAIWVLFVSFFRKPKFNNSFAASRVLALIVFLILLWIPAIF